MKHAFASVIWLFTMASIGAWFAVMALDNEPPWSYLDEAHGSHIVPNPADQDQMVSTKWLLTDKKKECPRQVERIFSDLDTGKVLTTLDATPLSRMNTDDKKLSRSFQLPPNLPPRVGYRAKACFQCNILQMIWPLCITSPELPININPPAPSNRR